ncbi:MAG TPA: ABC transporter ATP-binding protein [Devosia sp.]|nr:ABC transporter ATP-binding protein [Devosia sp.]
MIDAKNVSKSYGTTVVVDDVSLQLPARGITSIIGPNGAGKSTLLGMMSRLLPMNAGTVTVAGLDVTKTPGEVLAKRLAILRQDNQIAARLTVEDLVSFGRYPHSKGRLNAEDRRHIDEAIGYLNLDELRGRFLDELSGGQRQRAYVAMVLAQDTEYLLLDEPLNNLDMKHSVGMMRFLKRAASELGKTIVVVLHDINFASVYSDYIVCMQAGKIAHAGPPAAVITPEIMRSVYDIDVHVHTIGGQLISVYYD